MDNQDQLVLQGKQGKQGLKDPRVLPVLQEIPVHRELMGTKATPVNLVYKDLKVLPEPPVSPGHLDHQERWAQLVLQDRTVSQGSPEDRVVWGRQDPLVLQVHPVPRERLVKLGRMVSLVPRVLMVSQGKLVPREK